MVEAIDGSEEKLRGLFLHFNFFVFNEGNYKLSTIFPLCSVSCRQARSTNPASASHHSQRFFIEKLLLKNFLNASNLLVNKRPRRAKRNGKHKLASRVLQTLLTDCRCFQLRESFSCHVFATTNFASIASQISEWFAIVYIITRGASKFATVCCRYQWNVISSRTFVSIFHKLALRDESKRNERQGKAIAKAHENHFRVDGEFSCSTSCFYGKQDCQESNEKRYR